MKVTMNAEDAAVYQRVLERDRYQCQVCGTTENIQVHHWREFRSQLGKNTEDNLVVMCFNHHMALHRGELSITLHKVGGVWRSFVQRHR